MWSTSGICGAGRRLEGLLHLSEMGDGALKEPYSYVQKGDHLSLRISHMEPEKTPRRLHAALGDGRRRASPAASQPRQRQLRLGSARELPVHALLTACIAACTMPPIVWLGTGLSPRGAMRRRNNASEPGHAASPQPGFVLPAAASDRPSVASQSFGGYVDGNASANGNRRAWRGNDFAALLEESLAASSIERSDIVNGTVMGIDSQGLIVDIGWKQDGIVTRNDIERDWA